MSLETYTNHFKAMVNKTSLVKERKLLSDIPLDSLVKIDDLRVIEKSYYDELENALGTRTLAELLTAIDRIDIYLAKAKERLSLEQSPIEQELPDISELYHSLTPLVLRMLRELSLDDDGREAFEQGIQESIKIAIEQEITVWQENF